MIPIVANISQRALRAKRELVWVAIGQLAALSGAFVGIKVLTNALGAEKYGQLALGISIAGLANLFVYGPFSQWTLRFFSIYRQRKELDIYFKAVRRIYVLATLGICAFALTSMAILIVFLESEWIFLLFAASLFAIVSGANGIFVSLQSAVRERKVVAFHQGLDAWLKPALALAALYLISNSGYFALLGFFLGTFLVTTSQVICARRSAMLSGFVEYPARGTALSDTMRREFIDYVAPFLLFALFGAVSLYGDRWLLQGMFGAREVGVYTALYQIANGPITLLIGFVSQLMMPVIFDRAGTMTTSGQAKSSLSGVYEAVGVASIVMLGMLIIAYLFGEQLVVFLTAHEFAQYHEILWVLALALCLFNIGQLLTLQGFSSRQTGLYVWPKAAQAVSFLVLAYLLAKEWAINGVAVALAISSLIYLCLVIRANRRVGVRRA